MLDRQRPPGRGPVPGRLGFGGTVAFVFADLIAFPLVAVYAKLYGRRIVVRLFLAFWAVMSVAGLATDLLFRGLGIPAPARPAEIVPARFEWNYTTWLNLAAIAATVVLYRLYRRRDRLGSAGRYAKDTVCGMQVEKAHAPATAAHAGHTYWFCSDRCHEKFTADPDRYAHGAGSEPMDAEDSGETAVDPVCGMDVDLQNPGGGILTHEGAGYAFCSSACREAFAADPRAYLQPDHARGMGEGSGMAVDPVCGMAVAPRHASAHFEHDGRFFSFCSADCRDAFAAQPQSYAGGRGG